MSVHRPARNRVAAPSGTPATADDAGSKPLMPHDRGAPRPTVTDPRHWQLLFLGGFLAWGLQRNYLSIGIADICVYLGCSLACQLGWALFRHNLDTSQALKWRDCGWQSAAITGLSLCLLLRTNSLALCAVAAVLAISSKQLITYRGRHLFNPTNIAIVILLLGSQHAWVSPGQWGHDLLLIILFGGLGLVVTVKSARLDTAGYFMACYAGLIFIRALYLGDPWPIAVHQLQDGALLLFAFFMITDPKTTPAHTTARMLYAAAIALTAYWFKFELHQSAGQFYALALVCAGVPLLNRLYSAPVFYWQHPPQDKHTRT